MIYFRLILNLVAIVVTTWMAVLIIKNKRKARKMQEDLEIQKMLAEGTE